MVYTCEDDVYEMYVLDPCSSCFRIWDPGG